MNSMKWCRQLLIVAIIAVVFTTGCASQQSSSPESTVKAELDNVLKGNYDGAFAYFVDSNGNTISQDFRQQIKTSIERNPLSGYEIKETASADLNRPEYSILRQTNFTEVKVVSFTTTEKSTKKITKGKVMLVQHQGSWKILILLPPQAQPQAAIAGTPASPAIQRSASNATPPAQPAASAAIPSAPAVSSPPAPSGTSAPAETRTSYLGLWKAERVFVFDNAAQAYKEGNLTADFYMEYTGDGRWCVMWSQQQGKCLKYDSYTANGDIITQHQEGFQGPPWRYKWNLAAGKLELRSEIFLNSSWLPFIKYSLMPIPYLSPAPPAPAAVASAPSVVVQATSVASISCDGKTYNLSVPPNHTIRSIWLKAEDKQKIADMKSAGIIDEVGEIARNDGASLLKYSAANYNNTLPSAWAIFLIDYKSNNEDAMYSKLRETVHSEYIMVLTALTFGESRFFPITCKAI